MNQQNNQMGGGQMSGGQASCFAKQVVCFHVLTRTSLFRG